MRWRRVRQLGMLPVLGLVALVEEAAVAVARVPERRPSAFKPGGHPARGRVEVT